MSGRRMGLRRIHHRRRPHARHITLNLGGRRRRRMRGSGLGDFLKKANSYLRDNKIISRVANTLAESGVAPGISSTVGKIAGTLGYGRRHRRHRMHRGGALKLAGMGLSPAGGRRHYRHHRRY